MAKLSMVTDQNTDDVDIYIVKVEVHDVCDVLWNVSETKMAWWVDRLVGTW